MDTYSPGQVKAIFKHVIGAPQWFVIGGPANGDEAQVFCEHFPGCKALGVEPVRELMKWQREHAFPGELVTGALGCAHGATRIVVPEDRLLGASAVRPVKGEERMVPTFMLDFLDSVKGPFTGGVLWLDIEGSELDALLGATRLLKQRTFQLISVELMPTERPEDAKLIDRMLRRNGYEVAEVWNQQGEHHRDVAYVKACP